MKDYLERADKALANSARTLISIEKESYNAADYTVLMTLHSMLQLLTAHTLLLRHIIDNLPEES